jgi:hypothetical protein
MYFTLFLQCLSLDSEVRRRYVCTLSRGSVEYVLIGVISQCRFLPWTPPLGEPIYQPAVLIEHLRVQGSSLGLVPRTIMLYVFVRSLSGKGKL